MEKVHIRFISFVRDYSAVAFLSGFFISALSFLFLVLSQENFKVQTDFLIAQKNTQSQDFYTFSRSNEYIGTVLSQAIYSELFINEVLIQNPSLKNLLAADQKQRLDRWKKMILIENKTNVGAFSVTVFHDDQKNALEITEAVTAVLLLKNDLFTGSSDIISMRVLSGPILEKNPSVMQIISVCSLGFAIGFIIIVFFIYSRFLYLVDKSVITYES